MHCEELFVEEPEKKTVNEYAERDRKVFASLRTGIDFVEPR
jgi:hypothetical protein